MKICNHKHVEIAYTTNNCPLCKLERDNKSQFDFIKAMGLETTFHIWTCDVHNLTNNAEIMKKHIEVLRN